MTRSVKALSTIEEQITCPVCLEHYKHPKLLPCAHSLCLGCLQTLPTVTVEGNRSIQCPVCRIHCHVPKKGLDSLPPSFVINNIMEVYDLMNNDNQCDVTCGNCGKTNPDHYCKQCSMFYCTDCLSLLHSKLVTDHQLLSLTSDTQSEPVMTCSTHAKPLHIFCETCQHLICHDCTVKKHKDHDYDVVTDESYKRNYDSIVNSSHKPLQSELDRLITAKENLEKQRSQVTKEAEETIVEIQKRVAIAKNQIDEKGKKLANTVNEVLEDKHDSLDLQLEELDSAIYQVTGCMDDVDHCITVCSPLHMLSIKSQIVGKAQRVVTTCHGKSFEPLEQADITLVKTRSIAEIPDDIIGKIGFSRFKSSKLKIHQPCSPIWGRQATVYISFDMPDGSHVPVPASLVKCHLVPPEGTHRPIRCSVKASRSLTGRYNVTFMSSIRGNHQLRVTVNDKRVRDSPVSIPVRGAMEVPDPPITKIHRLKGPSGVGVTHDGLIVVSESEGNCITVLDRTGRNITSFGSKGKEQGELRYPQGVAITSRGTVVVADTKNHRIQEFTLEGESLSCVGSKGTGPLQFKYPHGIAIDRRSNHVFVADNDNHRIQVLGPNLSFLRTIGNNGYISMRLFQPHDIAIDERGGFIYVTDFGRNRIVKLTITGQFVTVFGTKGSQPGQVYRPSGIAIDENGFIGVNNSMNQYITVFDGTGRHVNSIDKAERDLTLLYPPLMGMASDEHGQLLVCKPSHNEFFII